MEAFLGLLSFLGFAGFVGGIIWAVVRNFKKQSGQRQYLYALGGFAAFLICIFVDAALFPTDAKPEGQRNQDVKIKAAQLPTPSPRSTRSTSPAPSASRSDSADLQKFRSDWKDIVERTAYSAREMDKVRSDLARGDTVDASGELKNCQDEASGIKDDAYDLPLDLNNDSDNELLQSLAAIGDGFGYGCKSFRAYLDTNAPSDASDAKAYFGKANDAIEDATLLVMSKYVGMGGRYQDLPDFKSAMSQ